MATGRLAAAGHARMIETGGIGKRCRAMASAAIGIRRDVPIRLAEGDRPVMARHALLAIHFGTGVIEGAPGKRCGCRRIACVAN